LRFVFGRVRFAPEAVTRFAADFTIGVADPVTHPCRTLSQRHCRNESYSSPEQDSAEKAAGPDPRANQSADLDFPGVAATICRKGKGEAMRFSLGQALLTRSEISPFSLDLGQRFGTLTFRLKGIAAWRPRFSSRLPTSARRSSGTPFRSQ
jgi:hypothetical protein